MVSSKRSSRLAARKSRPQYSELTSDQEEDDETYYADSDAEGECKLSGGESDYASDSAPGESSSLTAKTGAVSRRREVTDTKRRQSSETSTSSDKRAHKGKPKTQLMITASNFSRAENPLRSPPTVGYDHVEGGNTFGDQNDTLVGRKKRMSSASNESLKNKRSKASVDGNGKLPSSDNSISESIDDRTKGGVGPPSQFSNSARSGEEVVGVPATSFRKCGRKRVASLICGDKRSLNSDSDEDTHNELEPKTVKDTVQCNFPISADSNNAPHQQKEDDPPSSSCISGNIPRNENGAKSNASTDFDTTKYTEGLTQQSADSTDSNKKRSRNSSGNESVEWGSDHTSRGSAMKVDGNNIEDCTQALVAGANDVAKSESSSSTEPTITSEPLHHTIDILLYERLSPASTTSTNVNGDDGQTSVVLSTQVHRQEHERDNGALVASTSDVEEQKIALESYSLIEPDVSSAPRQHEIEILSCETESPACKEEHSEYHSDGRKCEVSDPANTNGVDGNEAERSKSQYQDTMDLSVSSVDSGENANLNSVTSKAAPNNALDRKLDVEPGCDETMGIIPDEAVVHQPTIQIPVERDCLFTSINETSIDSAVSMSILYPETTRTREAHSVGQLKMALFLEASKVYRGKRADHIFAKYWQTVGEYITFGSNKGFIRVRSDLSSSSCAGIEDILRRILKTRKMKRLHNKLILAIMASATRTDAPARLSTHIPQQWKTKTIEFYDDDVMVKVEFRDRKSYLRQWSSDFGPQSGTWTACMNEIPITKTDSSNEIHPNLVGSIHSGDHAEDIFLPSARLPGALQIEPLVRKHAAHSGLTASENAIWMLVVAVREYSSALIKKIMSNDKDFGNGYAPRVPNHFQTSLACPRVSSEKSENHNKSDVEENNTGKRVINSICLSHVLAENPSATSRLASMYSVTLDNWRGSASHAGLDNVNFIINSSIQRAASRRQMISQNLQSVPSTGAISKSTLKSPARNMNVSARAQSDASSAKSQLYSSHTFPAASVLKSTLADPAHVNICSSAQSDESSAKTQLHSTTTSATSLLKSTLAYPVQMNMSSSAQSDESSAKTQLHSTQTFPATSLFPQRIDHHITTPLLQSQLSLPSMPSRNAQSLYSMQMMNQKTAQHMQPSLSNFIQNLMPLAKPGFPEIINTHKKSELPPIVFTKADQPQNSATPMKTSYPSSAFPRGSKDLAALLATPTSQPDPASTNESISSDENRADKATLDKPGLREKDPTGSEKDVTNVEKDDGKHMRPVANITIRPRGRGFGVKNLAAIRARSSFTDSTRSSFSDSGK